MLTMEPANLFDTEALDTLDAFGEFGALSEEDKKQLAERLKKVSVSFIDAKALLQTIPDADSRADVALKAIAIGDHVKKYPRCTRSHRS